MEENSLASLNKIAHAMNWGKVIESKIMQFIIILFIMVRFAT